MTRLDESFQRAVCMCHRSCSRSPDQAELAANWNLAAGVTDPTGDDISDLCGLWNMAPAEAPSRGLMLSLSLSLSSVFCGSSSLTVCGSLFRRLGKKTGGDHNGTGR